MKRIGRLLLFTTLLLFLGVATSQTQPHAEDTFKVERDADVPELPFPDNTDPTVCGIPVPFGEDNQAWLTGYYQNELIQPTVFLYDSHARRSITGRAPSGAEVEVVLSQTNPTLNDYLVRTVGDEVQEGWIPAPFLSFEPPGSF